MHEKTEYIVHIRNSKQALNHGLVLKKIHRAISFNQDEWLKSYTELNAKLRKKVKNEFGKKFFKLMNNSFFSKTMKNLRKYKDLKLKKNGKKRELFGVTAKLLLYKVFLRKFNIDRHEKETNNHEQACLFGIIDIRSE